MKPANWIPCIYEMSKPNTEVQMAGPYFDNVGGTDFEMNFRLPIPMKDGPHALFIDGLQIGMFDADPANCVRHVIVYGVSISANVKILDSDEQLTRRMLKTYDFAAQNLSQWEAVCVRIFCRVSAPNDLNISSVSLRCSYK